MSLLFTMSSTFVIAFLPRSKHLLISWLKTPSAVILEPKKIKSVTVAIVSPSISHEELRFALKRAGSLHSRPLRAAGEEGAEHLLGLLLYSEAFIQKRQRFF